MGPKILVLAGSLRKGAFSKQLARAAAKAAERAGAGVTLIELEDYPLPPYDGDLEASEGLPESAKRLRELFIASDGVLLVTPEYNGGIPGTFKNAIDWVSRGEEGEGELTPYDGRPFAIMSSSPGALGGMRSLAALRLVLAAVGALVAPGQVSLPKAHEAFAPDGSLSDPRRAKQVEGAVGGFVELLEKLIPPPPERARERPTERGSGPSTGEARA